MLKTGEEKRNSYNYRDKYLKHNPGFFSSFYICSQCFKPIRKDELEVDHIFPISRWWAPNHLINLVATCRACNRKKSDKINSKIQIKGVIIKFLEELYVLVHNLFLLTIKGILFISSYLINYFGDLVKRQFKVSILLLIILVIIFVFFK